MSLIAAAPGAGDAIGGIAKAGSYTSKLGKIIKTAGVTANTGLAVYNGANTIGNMYDYYIVQGNKVGPEALLYGASLYLDGKAVGHGVKNLNGLLGSSKSHVGNSGSATPPEGNASVEQNALIKPNGGNINDNPTKTLPQQLAREGQVPAIGKTKDLNTAGNVVNGEFKAADYLPDMGNPKANWHQNSGILRSVMNEGVPIKDVSMFPMDNAGFLGAERNLLQSRGWTYLEGYWYPPQ